MYVLYCLKVLSICYIIEYEEVLYMTKIITFGLQKGGVSKTTTAGIISYLSSNDNKKILAVDFDSQGNLTELLTNEPANNFINKSIFEAITFREYKSPSDYIQEVKMNLDILPANNLLASYPKWLYTKQMPSVEDKISYEGPAVQQLRLTLDEVKDEYDYIFIDTPPALSEQTTNALAASDFVIVLYECSKFCYSAIDNFMETVELIQSTVKTDLINLGISRTLSDNRRKDAHFFNKVIEKDYPELVFNTIINRKATTGRLPLQGFEENKELSDALSQYKNLYKEIMQRIQEKSDKNE